MGNENETKNNIQFRYDSDTKTLFLRGSGPIKDFAIIDSLYSDETDIIEFQPDDYADYQKMDSDIKYLITPWASVEFTSLVIEEGITVIGASAFFHCYNLETVTLPRGLKKIRPFAFRACKSIKKVIMPPEAITIERAAFENCANLETVELPSGSFVNHEAFKNCPKLKKIFFDGQVEVDAGAFDSIDVIKDDSTAITEGGETGYGTSLVLTKLNKEKWYNI